MSKIAFLAILTAGFSAEMWGVCPYQDCGQYVITHQLILQQKITSNLNLVYNSIDSLETAQTEHTNALNEQVSAIETLSVLSEKSNLALREIAIEQKKQADLLAVENLLLAKRAEALNTQGQHLSAVAKIKAEE